MLQLELFDEPPRVIAWGAGRSYRCGIAASQIYRKCSIDIPYRLWPERCGVCQYDTECRELYYPG